MILSESRMHKLQTIIGDAPPNALRSKRSREELAHKIAGVLGMYEVRVREFVEEMAGLNFFNPEDRFLFIQFAERGL